MESSRRSTGGSEFKESCLQVEVSPHKLGKGYLVILERYLIPSATVLSM